MAAIKKKLFTADDSPEMRAAIMTLVRRSYFVHRCSQLHIKVYELNFWPHTGTITEDSRGRHNIKGFAEFLKLLETRYPKRKAKPVSVWPDHDKVDPTPAVCTLRLGAPAPTDGTENNLG